MACARLAARVPDEGTLQLEDRLRTRVLTALHIVIALNAIGGGIFGLAGAPGVPAELLRGSPFANYLVPSLILLVVVGGAHAAAGGGVLRRTAGARRLSLAAGVILLAWIGVQVAIIGYVSWLQPAMALAAGTNLALAWGLSRPSGAPA